MPKAISWCMAATRFALENNMDVCVANTFTKKCYVDSYKALAEVYGADFKVYRCTGKFKNVHKLPDSMVQSFTNSMEDYPGEIMI